MKLHTDFFEKLHEKFPTMKEDAVIEGFYKFLKDIAIESNINYPREIDISTVTGTSIKFTDTKGNTIGIIEPVKKENFNHGIQLRVDDQVLGLFISDEHIATAIAPTPVPMQEGGNPKSIVTLDSFKQLAIYTLEELGLSFTEDGFIEIDKGDNSLSSVGFVKQQLDALKQEIIDMIPTNEEIYKLANLPRGSIIVWTFKDIPYGWVICDGTNGTPDMRDKFIVGASNNRDINVIVGAGSLNGLGHYYGFYSVYYIMKISSISAEFDEIIWDSVPTPGSLNPVTSGGIYTYYESKLKAMSDRIVSISELIYKLQAKVDEYHKNGGDGDGDGYEYLVYAPKTGVGNWTSVVGQEYPAYQLGGGAECPNWTNGEGSEHKPPTTKYAVYRCIEPSTCKVEFHGLDLNGHPKWTIEETRGKFEFVRWENA